MVIADVHVPESEVAEDRDRQEPDICRAVAEPPGSVEAPAIGSVIRGHAAAVAGAGAYLTERQRLSCRGDRDRRPGCRACG
jgi:hypothetical protein